MLHRIVDTLTGRTPEERPDPLADMIEHAEAVKRDAIAAVNESRRRRGEPELDPSWEELLGATVTSDKRNGHGP